MKNPPERWVRAGMMHNMPYVNIDDLMIRLQEDADREKKLGNIDYEDGLMGVVTILKALREDCICDT